MTDTVKEAEAEAGEWLRLERQSMPYATHIHAIGTIHAISHAPYRCLPNEARQEPARPIHYYLKPPYTISVRAHTNGA